MLALGSLFVPLLDLGGSERAEADRDRREAAIFALADGHDPALVAILQLLLQGLRTVLPEVRVRANGSTGPL